MWILEKRINIFLTINILSFVIINQKVSIFEKLLDVQLPRGATRVIFLLCWKCFLQFLHICNFWRRRLSKKERWDKQNQVACFLMDSGVFQFKIFKKISQWQKLALNFSYSPPYHQIYSKYFTSEDISLIPPTRLIIPHCIASIHMAVWEISLINCHCKEVSFQQSAVFDDESIHNNTNSKNKQP